MNKEELEFLEDNISTVAWHLGQPGARLNVSHDKGAGLLVDPGEVLKEIARRLAARAQSPMHRVGKYRADYSPLTPGEIAKPDPELTELYARSRPAQRPDMTDKPRLLDTNPKLFNILNDALGTMHYHRLMSALNWNGYQIVRSHAQGAPDNPMVPWELNCLQTVCSAPECDCAPAQGAPDDQRMSEDMILAHNARKIAIEECERIAKQTSLRCVREGIPGDSVANFIAQNIRALSNPSTGREYDPNVSPCDDAEFGMKP